MPIDPYSPCPGGTGKKVKFCCTDLQQELDKVERMLEGEQSKACLDYVRKLDEKYAGRACLQSIRISLENAVGDHEAAHGTLSAFLKQHPDNPVALAEQAIDQAAHGDPLAGIPWLQKALEVCARRNASTRLRRIRRAGDGVAIGRARRAGSSALAIADGYFERPRRARGLGVVTVGRFTERAAAAERFTATGSRAGRRAVAVSISARWTTPSAVTGKKRPTLGQR